MKNLITTSGIHILPLGTSLFIPPMTWKGDPLGHIGENDVFFWVLEGECFLKVESDYSVIHSGQLAFLPKGKMRSYTQISPVFSMYETAFSASIDGMNLMSYFGMCDGDYVVGIEDGSAVCRLFESSYRTEMNKNPLHDVKGCADILNIINIYCTARRAHSNSGKAFFAPVVKYMEANLGKKIKIDELSAIMYMEPTYFIRKFKKEFDVPPMTYLIRMRMCKAMEYLSCGAYSIEAVSGMVGISDPAYFSRLFKKFCNASPSEYRKAFCGNNINRSSFPQSFAELKK